MALMLIVLQRPVNFSLSLSHNIYMESYIVRTGTELYYTNCKVVLVSLQLCYIVEQPCKETLAHNIHVLTTTTVQQSCTLTQLPQLSSYFCSIFQVTSIQVVLKTPFLNKHNQLSLNEFFHLLFTIHDDVIYIFKAILM